MEFQITENRQETLLMKTTLCQKYKQTPPNCEWWCLTQGNLPTYTSANPFPLVSDKGTMVSLLEQVTYDLVLKKADKRAFHKKQTACPHNASDCQHGHTFLFCYAEDNSYPSEFIHHFMNKIKTHLQILLHKQATSFLNHQIQHSPLQWVRDELSLTAFARYIQTAETRLASSTSWRFAKTKCCLAR